MEKKSKVDKKNKKDKDKHVVHVVNSDEELIEAFKEKLSFELGPSFTSLKLPLQVELPKDPSANILATLADNTTLTEFTLRYMALWNKKTLDALETNLIANKSITKLIFDIFSFEQSSVSFMKTIVKILTTNHRIQEVEFRGSHDRESTYDLFCENMHLYAFNTFTIANLSNFNYLALFKALPQSTTISTLKLDVLPTNEAFACLCEALIANPRITNLEISSTQGMIGGDRWMKFVSVLERGSLKRLNLTNSMKAQFQFDEISEALRRTETLQELAVQNSQISWTSIGAVLSANKSLKRLNLDQSFIADGRFAELELNKNATLTELSLIGCKFKGQHLWDCIRDNRTLHILHTEVAYATFDIDGFIQALKTNGSLTELDLVRSSVPLRPINDPEPDPSKEPNISLCEVFADILTVNKSLQKLKFPGDKCDYASLCKFLDSLKHNATLTELSLGHNLALLGSLNKPSGAASVEQVLTDLLKVNKTLTVVHGTAQMREIDGALRSNQPTNAK